MDYGALFQNSFEIEVANEGGFIVNNRHGRWAFSNLTDLSDFLGAHEQAYKLQRLELKADANDDPL